VKRGNFASPETATLVIGIGNDFRKDDAAGLIAAKRLRAVAGKNVAIQEQSGEATALMEAWQGRAKVILIDAAKCTGAPGTLHRFDAVKRPLPGGLLRYSSHQLSVVDAIELARALNRLPGELIVYGIEGKHFDAGKGLSAEVERSIPELVERVRREISGD